MSRTIAPNKSAALVRIIDDLGYAMYWHVPPLFNPNNYFGNPINVFGDTVSMNMLCVHRSVPLSVEGSRRVKVPPL